MRRYLFRKLEKSFLKEINGTTYKFYSVYYPVGNGRFNIDKSIEDIKWIMNHELEQSKDMIHS